MEFRILGPLEAADDAGLVDLGGGKGRALLALLLLHADRVVPVDRIVDGLWDEDVPESAQKMVQIFVSRLRKQLPGGLIETRPPGYRLDLDGHRLDLHAFAALHARGRDALARGHPQAASEALRSALELWRGAPLAEFQEPFARIEEARLAEQHVACLEDHFDAELALGRHTALVAELEASVRRHPLRERVRGQQILALYRSGRHADALQALQSFKRKLQDELGLDPPPRLRELEGLVLRQDASLELGPREQTVPSVVTVPTLVPRDDDSPAVSAQERPPLVEVRKTVTVLVADIAPADAPDDPEAWRTAVLEKARAVEAVLGRHGATFADLGGGRILGVFGVPAAQDDDSLRAVAAAVALRSSALAARVGVATGEVVTGEPIVSGPPVDAAARLQERAHAGDVLVAARTWRVVRHAVEAAPRGGAWAVAAVDSDAAPLVRRLETPLVGRERELRAIVESFERAATEGAPHLVTVFGAPGVGKTRIALECVERLGEAAAPAVGRCRAGPGAATYAPLRDVLAELADGGLAEWICGRLGAEDGTHLAEQLVTAIGLAEGAAHTEDVALAARRLFAGLAGERPLLLVLEDVHWGAPAFLDLVESLVELAHAPVLVLCCARPDLLDVRPHWGGGRLSSSAVLLDSLTPAESELLLDGLASGERLEAAARGRIVSVAEGNPLFIEQLLAAALEGDLKTIPDSIQSLLAARLDRLDPLDRAVVEAAAVCGASFSTPDVAALVDGDAAASLVRLVRRELTRPGEAGDPGREGWSFRHGLIRDVAYGSIPKRRRAELHERLAARALEGGGEGDARAGSHLYQAVRVRREAGEQGPALDALASRAAEHLRRSGQAAFDRDDWAETAALLEQASELLPRDAPERVELLPKLGEALMWVGRRDDAHARHAEASALATEIGDSRLVVRARLSAVLGTMMTDEAAAPEQLLLEIEDAMPVIESAGDHEALAAAELVRFHALDRARLESPEERLTVALAHARKAGARQIEHRVLSWICITLPRGTMPVDAAIAELDDIARASSSAFVYASARGARGLLRAEQGEFEEARALVEETRRALEELGLWLSAAEHSIAIAEVEMMAGDDDAAERVLRDGLAVLTAAGDDHSTTHVAWRLGLVLARRGRHDEAERFARMAEHGPSAGLWVDVWWRIVLALVEAHRGAVGRACDLVAEARARMAPAPESGMHADALLECAEVLRAAGRAEEAAALVTEAAGIAERLGYLVALRRAEDARRTLDV
jgi:DNA-binding SARP family transcriptional activator